MEMFHIMMLASFCNGFSSPHNIQGSSFNYLNIRHKRQDDKWNWGLILPDSPPTNEPTTPGSSLNFQEPNPCLNRTFSPKPDFNAMRRRISETKCLEYIWEVKHRDERDKRATECIKYRMKHRNKNYPHFAIGGCNTEPGEFPHMGAIGWAATVGTWIFKCGGSLISPSFVLTAAHCTSAPLRDTSKADPLPKIVRLGDKNILDKFTNGALPTDANITRIIAHPSYTAPKKYFDIALLELGKEVVFSKYIQPACLWGRMDFSSLGMKATLTGWGVVESGARDISPELQAAEVDVIDTEQCDGFLRPNCNRNWCGLRGHQLCAGKLAGGVDACDSGGPLQVKIPLPVSSQGAMHYVIGVTSFGIECALPNLPGVYTRVSSFIDWIENIVWQE